MILTHLVLFSFLDGASDAAAPPPPPPPSGPTRAGRHRKRHEGRKQYGAEIDGHLVIADSKEELARKLEALQPSLPEFHESIEVPVAPDESSALLRKPSRKARRTQEKPFGLPDVEEPVDLGLAKEAVAAVFRARQAKENVADARRMADEAMRQRIRQQEEHRRRLAAIQADDETVIELFLQILNSEDD